MAELLLAFAKMVRKFGRFSARTERTARVLAVITFLYVVPAIRSDNSGRLDSGGEGDFPFDVDDGGPAGGERDCSCDWLCWWTGSCCDGFWPGRQCAQAAKDQSLFENHHRGRLRRMAHTEEDSNSSAPADCIDEEALTTNELGAAMSFVFADAPMERLRQTTWRSNFT